MVMLCNRYSARCIGLSKIECDIALQQVQDDLEGQLKKARQKDASQQKQLKEAALAEQQELQEQLAR